MDITDDGNSIPFHHCHHLLTGQVKLLLLFVNYTNDPKEQQTGLVAANSGLFLVVLAL